MTSIHKQYKLNSKNSLCKSKSKPKCNRIKGCKYTKGTTRKFCRKRKNKTYKKK